MKNQGTLAGWRRPFVASANFFWLGVAGLLLTPLESRAAGVVDLGFNLPAAYQGSSQLAVRALPSGKTMLVTPATITRLNQDGSEDGSYHVAQIASANAQAAMILPDGRVVIAGRQPLAINGTPYGSVVRLLANGAVDPGFESLAGNTFIDFRTVLVDSQDRVYLGMRSHSNTLGGQSVDRLVRLRADGTLDAEWQPNLGNIVNPSIALFPNDDLLLARSNLEVVRLSPTGEILPGFASLIGPVAGNNSFSLVDPAQRPVMGSLFIDSAFAYTNSLARLLPNGVIDPGFIPQPVTGQGYQAMAVDSFGRYYAGGSFLSYGGVARTRLVRLFPDGSLDESFVADANGSVTHLAFMVDGRLMVGGAFNQINGVAAPRLARLLVDDLSEAPRFQLVNTNFYDFDFAGLVSLPVMRVGPTNEAASVSFATSPGTALPVTDYLEVLGTLDFAPGEDLKHIEITLPRNAAIDPTRDFFVSLANPSAGTDLSARANARVTLIESDSEVFFEQAAKTFVEGAGKGTVRIRRQGTGSVAAVQVAAQDGTAIQGVDYQLTSTFAAFKEGEIARDIEVQLTDDAIELPDRDFTLLAVSPVGATLASPESVQVTIFDNDAANRPGLGIGSTGLTVAGILAIHRDASGRVLLGGGFNLVNGTPANNFVRLTPEGDLDPTFNSGSGPNGTVRVIVEDAEGRFLIGGNFTAYDGHPVGRVARIQADGSLDLPFVTGVGFSDFVESLELLIDGRILVGGNFKAYNGITRVGAAILQSNGSLDESYVPAADVPNFFFGHGAFQSPQGVLVIGQGNTGVTNAVFRLLPSGQRDPAFVVTLGRTGLIATPGVTGLVVKPNGRIVIVGTFNFVNGVPRNNVARLLADGSVDESFDPGAGADNWVFKVFRQADGKLVLTGFFLTYDGRPFPYVVRINADGSLDESLQLGTGPSDVVNSAWAGADNTLLLGGQFRKVGSVTRPGWAEIESNGTVALAIPRFLTAARANGVFTLEVEVEPEFDVQVWQSSTLDGWVPLETKRTFKRVLKFETPFESEENRYFRAERLPPQ